MRTTGMDPDQKPYVHTRWTRKGGPKRGLLASNRLGPPPVFGHFLGGLSPGHPPPQSCLDWPLPMHHRVSPQRTQEYDFAPLPSPLRPVEHSRGSTARSKPGSYPFIPWNVGHFGVVCPQVTPLPRAAWTGPYLSPIGLVPKGPSSMFSPQSPPPCGLWNSQGVPQHGQSQGHTLSYPLPYLLLPPFGDTLGWAAAGEL